MPFMLIGAFFPEAKVPLPLSLKGRVIVLSLQVSRPVTPCPGGTTTGRLYVLASEFVVVLFHSHPAAYCADISAVPSAMVGTPTFIVTFEPIVRVNDVLQPLAVVS